MSTDFIHVMWVLTQEDTTKFCGCERFKTYILLIAYLKFTTNVNIYIYSTKCQPNFTQFQ